MAGTESEDGPRLLRLVTRYSWQSADDTRNLKTLKEKEAEMQPKFDVRAAARRLGVSAITAQKQREQWQSQPQPQSVVPPSPPAIVNNNQPRKRDRDLLVKRTEDRASIRQNRHSQPSPNRAESPTSPKRAGSPTSPRVGSLRSPRAGSPTSPRARRQRHVHFQADEIGDEGGRIALPKSAGRGAAARYGSIERCSPELLLPDGTRISKKEIRGRAAQDMMNQAESLAEGIGKAAAVVGRAMNANIFTESQTHFLHPDQYRRPKCPKR
eukprot:gnl/TRDRNA2_/TRDRNA2_168539_c0_seq14.p1 gnl/TRDRNA2_/TRDRNA2_168539_c0~~gnl/TRDRNA2_/TRDRNA2_168539_c0_seq14.p1  ORF type:complete len:268 (+),score=16.64 gnl/TRDRNA2_/TRDRNA2_168539_c0_seq14:90-893(+)